MNERFNFIMFYRNLDPAEEAVIGIIAAILLVIFGSLIL